MCKPNAMHACMQIAEAPPLFIYKLENDTILWEKL
jgi:hypothetical protein